MNLIHIPPEAIRSLPESDRAILRQRIRGGSTQFGRYPEEQPILDLLARNAIPVQIADHKAWNNCPLCNPEGDAA